VAAFVRTAGCLLRTLPRTPGVRWDGPPVWCPTADTAAAGGPAATGSGRLAGVRWWVQPPQVRLADLAGEPAATRAPARDCDPAYPDFCIPPPPPDLDCGDVNGRNFTVLAPDRHGFDREATG
jgi:hypothetical protein